MVVSGVDERVIAKNTGLTIKVVKGLISRGNEKYDKYVAEYEEKANSTAGKHKIWLENHIDEAQDAILAAMNQTSDKRLAAENGWKLVDKISPRERQIEQSERPELHIHGDVEIRNMLIEMDKDQKELREYLATQNPNKHIKTGAEALPRAVSAEIVPPVVDAEIVSEEPSSE